MDFLGRSRGSQEPNHLHVVMFFCCCFCCIFSPLYLLPCVRLFFQSLCYLFPPPDVGLHLIIVLLFLCLQSIPLPRRLIMRRVNSLLLRLHSLRMMVLSGLLTAVHVCSFIGITTQVNTLHSGLWALVLSRDGVLFPSLFALAYDNSRFHVSS